MIGQALACTVALHLGDFDKAQEYAETAIRLFQQDGAEFGSLHLHTHLGQIKMMRGDLAGAEAQFREMEDRLSRLTGNPTRLMAVNHALRSEVAYEMNGLGASAQLLDNAMQSVEDSDAWLDILAAAYRVRTRLALTGAGLPARARTFQQGIGSDHGCVGQHRQISPEAHISGSQGRNRARAVRRARELGLLTDDYPVE